MSMFEEGGQPEPDQSMKRSSSLPNKSSTTSGILEEEEDDDEVRSLDDSNSSPEIDTSADIWNKDMERFTINNTSNMLINEDINNIIGLDERKQQKKQHKKGNNIVRSDSAKKLDPPCRDPPENGIWPVRDALSFTRFMTFYGHGSMTEEHVIAAKMIEEAREFRKKYCGGGSTTIVECNLNKVQHFVVGEKGIAELYYTSASNNNNNKNDVECSSLVKIPTIEKFIHDYKRLVEMSVHGAMRSFCFQRLQLLSQAFKMHVTVNHIVENEAQSSLLGADFYRTMKVDNHIHLAAAPSAKQFVLFVKEKLETEPDTVVTEDGQTLSQVFQEAGINPENLTIDAFSVLADHTVYQRFDNFNSKYSPFKLAQLRRIFLKVENVIHGRYFAELTKMVLGRHEASKGHNSAVEMRVSIYGMESSEWESLAKWILTDWDHPIYPGPIISSHNRWIIQVPRLWRIYYTKGSGNSANNKHLNNTKQPSFHDMLHNLFSPIFEATLRPEQHPQIAEFLTHIVGFDSVDDEGASEEPLTDMSPSQWTTKKNPHYSWQLYHLWANIEVLNQLRKSKGLNTFALRPHAGETGDEMHLAATYMLCPSINHGINLHGQVSLQYLYYLDQVGLSISPLSNNFLFRKIKSNPFPKFFTRGLNVTLSTDDPLLFHMSDDALLEEYSVARASYDLSMTDISEIARNSVLQSGFEDHLKAYWLGPDFHKGLTHCDEHKTHVPLIRAKFRVEHLAMEHMLVSLLDKGKGEDVLEEMMIQFGLARNAHRDILVRSSLEVPRSL